MRKGNEIKGLYLDGDLDTNQGEPSCDEVEDFMEHNMV